MIDYLSPTFLYNLAKDGLKLAFGRARKLTPEQKIELRQRWKPRFEEEIIKNWRDKLRSDVIIRDVRRVDNYPNTDSRKRGISPWFRVGLVDVYHRGIVVGLGWDRLVQDEHGNWREKELHEDFPEGEKALLAGRIPFENIEAVDWEGDEYYYFPHIYCHFCNRKEPYESIAYFTMIENPNTRPHYAELVEMRDVTRRTTKRRIWHIRKK